MSTGIPTDVRAAGMTAWLLVLALGAACEARIGAPIRVRSPKDAEPVMTGTEPTDSRSGAAEDGLGDVDALAAFRTGVRRLTRIEYDNTIRDLLGDVTRPGSRLLPDDSLDPFDSNYTRQTASEALVEAAQSLAEDITKRLMADSKRRRSILPCEPQGKDDTACLKNFIESFGRRVYRRPLKEEEVDALMTLREHSLRTYNHMETDFFTTVGLVLRTLLQSPDFLYRIEAAELRDGSGAVRLNDFETATRMSYLIWGSTPDDQLLDDAEAGLLKDSEQRRVIARRMFSGPKALAQLERFHAQWLGYRNLPQAPDLKDAFLRETAALLNHVILENKASYWDVFLAQGTFVDAPLARHYGWDDHTQNATNWVNYGELVQEPVGMRRGILSHASVLAAFSKFSETSPTQRGLFISTRLLCRDVPAPPANVDVDKVKEDGESHCKVDRLKQHRSGACAGCHAQLDVVGQGLEPFDTEGRYRTHDESDCLIETPGVIPGLGAFEGPAQLVERLVDSDELRQCFIRQFYRFAVGRLEEPSEEANLEVLGRAFSGVDDRLDELIAEFVAQDAFTLSRE